MSSSDLIRYGGLATMAAGVAFILAGLLSLANLVSSFLISLLILGEFLVLFGLVGFHALQQASYRTIGRAGFYTTIVAILLVVLGLIIFPLSLTFGAGLQTVGNVVQVIGLALYGVATLQVRVLPRWCGVAFIIVSPLAWILGIILGISVRELVFGLFWLALGYVLWSQREASAEQPRVS